MTTTEEMYKTLAYLEKNKPDSPVAPLLHLAIERGARIALDSMWRMWHNGNCYSANSIGELFCILERGV